MAEGYKSFWNGALCVKDLVGGGGVIQLHMVRWFEILIHDVM